MLIAYVKKYQPSLIQNQDATLDDLQTWYKESRKLFDSDHEFKKCAHMEVVHLQAKEKSAFTIWNILCDISRKAFQQIYDLLDVKIIERGESFYNPYLAKMIQMLEEKSLITKSNGAKCVFLKNFKTKEGTDLPLIVQKSDGGYNYATTDLAGFWHIG